MIRPDIFGISHDNHQDIEAFVHFWAVLGYMLGIKDEFNLCLLPVNVVKKASEIIMRYFILAAVQLETPQFKAMTQALLDGLSHFMPFMTYEIQMFLTRRAACVPGYQYNMSLDTEKHCRSVFSTENIQHFLKDRARTTGYEFMEFTFLYKIPVYNFTTYEIQNEVEGNAVKQNTKVPEDTVVENGKSRPMDDGFSARLRKYLGLTERTSITLTLVDYETEWEHALGDSRFYELSAENKKTLVLVDRLRKFFVQTKIGAQVMDWLMSVILWRFRRYSSTS